VNRKRPQDSPRDWYQMKAPVADGPAEVLIYDEIGWYGITATNFANDLKAIDADAITVRLNSPGGDVYDGIAILNALRGHKAKITTVIDGLAASAASFIAMAGDEIVMNRNSELMIHDAWGVSIGNAADLAKAAADLDRISDNIASIYAERAGGTVEEWRLIMRAETWYSAQEAVDVGLADRVDAKAEEPAPDEKAAARFDISVFNYAGRRAAPAPLRPTNGTESGPGSPAASTTPAGPAGSTQEGGLPVALTLTDEQETSIREALGLAVEATADEIVTAIEDLATKPAPAAAAPAALANDTVVAIDREVLATLQASAARGEAAAQRQENDDRERLVVDAIKAGKIPPARKDFWLDSLKADPGMADTLAKMAPGLIPVTPIGHGQDAEAKTSEDAIYASLYGSEA
jgi:ATP-dependent Clp endopeptidase proteolytic subunit ClpP